MSKLIKIFFTLSMAAAHSSYAQDTVFRCDPVGGGSPIYQTIPFKEGECALEQKKTFDTDTNIMGAGGTSGRNGVQGDSQPTSGNSSATPSGAPDNSLDEAALITGEEPELRVSDPANTPAREPAPGDSGTPADSGTTSTAAPGAGGAGFGSPGQVAPAGGLGP
jgi:hypothetical protein